MGKTTLASPENVTPSKDDIAKAKQDVKELATLNKSARDSKLLLCKKIWEFDQKRTWKLLGFESDLEFLKQHFPHESLGIHTWRENCRIYRQFLNQVNQMEGQDHRDADKSAYKLLEAVNQQVGENPTYLSEVARFSFAGDTKNDTEKNVKTIGEIYKGSDNVKDFKVKMAKKFDKTNKGHSVANSKPGKNAGGVINLTFKLEASQYDSVVAAFEALSVSLGTRKSFNDMSNEERGRLLSLLSLEITNNSDAKTAMDDQAKKAAARMHINHAYSLITGSNPTDAAIKKASDNFMRSLEDAVSDEESAEAS